MQIVCISLPLSLSPPLSVSLYAHISVTACCVFMSIFDLAWVSLEGACAEVPGCPGCFGLPKFLPTEPPGPRETGFWFTSKRGCKAWTVTARSVHSIINNSSKKTRLRHTLTSAALPDGPEGVLVRSGIGCGPGAPWGPNACQQNLTQASQSQHSK